MAESQSRYSIVERLTDKKLELISAKDKVEEKLEGIKQNILSLGVELEAYKIKAEEDTNRNIEERKADIVQLKDSLAFRNTNKDNRIKAIDLKIAEIDKALKSIESISEASSKEASSP